MHFDQSDVWKHVQLGHTLVQYFSVPSSYNFFHLSPKRDAINMTGRGKGGKVEGKGRRRATTPSRVAVGYDIGNRCGPLVSSLRSVGVWEEADVSRLYRPPLLDGQTVSHCGCRGEVRRVVGFSPVFHHSIAATIVT